jgi:uncharacterized membrane protein
VADTDRALRKGPQDGRDPVDLARLSGRIRGWRRSAVAPAAPAEQLALFSVARPEVRRPPRQSPATRPRPHPAMRAPVPLDMEARVLLAAAITAYVWLFSYWTLRNHAGLGTQAFDFGIYDQGLWLLSHFKSPFVTVMGRQLFGDHTSFILLPLVPFCWVFPTAKVLLVSQAAALGIAGWPAFLLAREKLRDEMLAALLAVAFLIQPVLGWTNLEHFHPDVFEVPLVMFALYFMVKERWIPFLVCVAVVLLVKEDVMLLTFALGLYVAYQYDRRVGFITCAISVLYAAIALWWVLPALNGVGTLNGWRVPFGGPAGFLRAVVAHPGRVISYTLTRDRLWYLWQLFAPLALVAVLAPSVLLIAVAALGSNLISTFPYQYDIHYHYSTLILPVIVAATVAGVATRRSPDERKKLVHLVLGASLLCAYLWGPTPLGRHEASIADPGSPVVASFHQAARMIPPDAVVSTFYGWLPQVDHREEVYMFPNPWKAAYWGTFKQEGQRLPQADGVQYLLLPKQLDPEPKAVFESIRDGFDVLYDQGGVVLLRKH